MKDVYLNLTHFCNMECPRCYLTKEMREDRSVMSLGTLEKILNLKCVKDSEDSVKLCWLGGEAMALPLEVLKDYRDLINKVVPNASNQLITNLYSLTDKQVDFIKETFYSIETTYAAGMKMSLDGSEAKYQERFKRNLKKLNDAGISCHVNVELNDKTIEAGVDHIIQLAKDTGQRSWEFDISVQFDVMFEQGVKVNEYSYAEDVPMTISYKQWADYVIQFIRDKNKQMKDLDLRIGFIDSCFSKHTDPFFNTMRADDYLTFTPNGDVLGAPVFSALKQIHYGNIHKNTEDEILNHPMKLKHTAWEKVGRFSNEDCGSCEFYAECKGGFSCVPINDGSGECIGMKSIRTFVKNYKVEFDEKPNELWNPSPHIPSMIN